MNIWEAVDINPPPKKDKDGNIIKEDPKANKNKFSRKF